MTNAKPPLPPDDLDGMNVATDDTGESSSQDRPAPPVPPADPVPAPPPAPPAVQGRLPTYSDPMAKSPGLALFLSILFPGLGHIYANAYERALMIIGGIGVSIWAIVHSEGRLWPLAFVIAFAYFFSIFDAFREAQIANLSEGEELPRPRQRGEGRLVFGVFLTVLAGLVLADNLGLFDIRWLYEWWPVLVLLIGVYFIGSWIWEKMRAASGRDDQDFE
jgi:hypothetical protein